MYKCSLTYGINSLRKRNNHCSLRLTCHVLFCSCFPKVLGQSHAMCLHIWCVPLFSRLLGIVVTWLEHLLYDQTSTFCISTILVLWSDNEVVKSFDIATIIVFWFPTSVADIQHVYKCNCLLLYLWTTTAPPAGTRTCRLVHKQIMTV